MKFTFIERKINVSDAFKDYATKKLSKLDRYFDKDTQTSVTLGIERGKHFAEVTVHTAHNIFRANTEGTDMYNAIDNSLSVIDRQIRKNKTRLQKRLRSGAFEKHMPPLSDNKDIAEEAEFKIIKTKRFSVKPMTPDEAILQMNLLGHEFFVFKNLSDDQTFSVVYKRKDGNYGLIEND